MHSVCGYPVKSTWLKAVKAGNYTGWPLLTAKNVAKYYPETTETPKGHLSQVRKNVRSTKPKPREMETSNTSTLRGRKVRDVYTRVYETRNTVFSDQTGAFPWRSRSGNKYIMVMVEIDSNAILVEPIKSRKDPELTRAYRSLMTRLGRSGIVPIKHILDNEVSEAMKDVIRDEYKMQMELAPPGCHRRNAAEVAIRNFKAHFLSILAGVADDFPMQLWDKLLPQAEITVNLIRQSNATPTVSAYAHLSGPFDYNKMPLAPMGCAVQVHEKTDKRGTWSYHSVDGWYLSTSPEHYRTHRCYVKDTGAERLTDTAQFSHKRITNPEVTAADKVMHAIADCIRQIKAVGSGDHATDERQLHQLSELAARAAGARSEPINPVAKSEQYAPLREPYDDTRRQTRSMSTTLDAQQSPRVEMQPPPRVATQPPPRVTPHASSHPATTTPPPPTSRRYTVRQRRRDAVVSTTVRSGLPSSNTRSKTTPPPPTPPPATWTRSKRRTSKLHQPTATTSKPRMTKGFAAVVKQVQAK